MSERIGLSNPCGELSLPPYPEFRKEPKEVPDGQTENKESPPSEKPFEPPIIPENWPTAEDFRSDMAQEPLPEEQIRSLYTRRYRVRVGTRRFELKKGFRRYIP